jgi:alpha-beta hydrolase superfamily lysophospholipase
MRRAGEAAVLVMWLVAPGTGAAETRVALDLRGHEQSLVVLGPESGPPAIVASGDGGWVHLGPDVAARLAARGYRVLGLDSRAYLSSFTKGSQTLRPEDVPGDVSRLVDLARDGRDAQVLLVGVSEGAGLEVLAASDPSLQPRLLGVVALGLPRANELGWRFRDALIYLTHKTPNEPTFDSADYVSRLGPVPLAALHSTHDEYVPVSEIEPLIESPGGTKRLWVIPASDHRFSNDGGGLDRCLDEALAWVRARRDAGGPGSK